MTIARPTPLGRRKISDGVRSGRRGPCCRALLLGTAAAALGGCANEAPVPIELVLHMNDSLGERFWATGLAVLIYGDATSCDELDREYQDTGNIADATCIDGRSQDLSCNVARKLSDFSVLSETATSVGLQVRPGTRQVVVVAYDDEWDSSSRKVQAWGCSGGVQITAGEAAEVAVTLDKAAPRSTCPDGGACATQPLCTTDSFTDGDCDCGCGYPDPDCGRGGCTGRQCTAATCDVCRNAAGLPDVCDVAAQGKWTCSISKFGSGGDCDCGCGFPDPDCGTTPPSGCAAASCVEVDGCDGCYKEAGKPIVCLVSARAWTCNPSQFDDIFCDCGCTVADPSCARVDSCVEPGCDKPGCDFRH